MKTTAALFFFTTCLLTGCAQMGTRQIDRNTTTRYEIDKTGKTNAITTEVRETSTRAKGTALGAGQTALKGFEAKQDGGIQGLKIKESSQQTDGLTQAVESFRALSDIGRMIYGIPPSQSAPAQPTAPAGMKWILAPVEQPSKPKLQTE